MSSVAAPAVAPAGPLQRTLQSHGIERPANLREQMERSTSEGIREEGIELKEAAQQSLNVVVDLSLDGVIRWVSPTWPDVVGTDPESVQDKPIAEILVESPETFVEATDALRKSDSGSRVIRFSVYTGPKSRFAGNDDEDEEEEEERADSQSDDNGGDKTSRRPSNEPKVLNLEAQGIMVYNKAGQEDHTMWMIRPAIQVEVTIDLPPILVESLGVGAEVLAQHLTTIADSGTKDPESLPPAIPVLCRICERQITPWWFPKHTELCLQEHRAEADLASAHENLAEHRNQIVKVLDALEAKTRHQRSSTTASDHSAMPEALYKGMAIGSTASSNNSSSNNSRSSSVSRSRDRLDVVRPHHRQRSFTVRRPPARIVELVLDLCDTSLEISTPALKESRAAEPGSFRSQSPQSEGRISQVLQWQSPSAGALENEPGLAALCDDTTNLAKAKVDAVMRYRQILEYSERIRSEFTSLVQECIDAGLDKASRIVAGESASESSDQESTSKEDNTEGEQTQEEDNGSSGAREPSETGARRLQPPQPIDAPSAMAMALRNVAHTSSSTTSSPSRRRLSIAMSDPPSSAHFTTTPRTKTPTSGTHPPEARMSWMSNETDHDNESDNSLPSSRANNRAQSPASEAAMSRAPSSRGKRKSLVLPRAMSASRAHSPARPPTQPLSPLRVAKPRLPSGNFEGTKSPLMSPTLSSSEFCSPTWGAPQLPNLHRRQSSAASSEVSRAPHSPNLAMSNAPQPRAAPPSIKDFEIIKPISKGAFGSVYLAKKKSTGDYYAIKALKKADMVSKNQVANVKAERAILMWQGESDFVAKLYWTFPSKDYIFLVMEYLNGGDCAALVKALGSLPEDWAKRYLAEVVQGVEHLHSREIVHRDLKPDNLLIDQKGHLKLTDFGLSRMGLIGRQKRALNSKPDQLQPDPLKQSAFARSASITSSRSASMDVAAGPSPGATPALTPMNGDVPSYFSLTRESSLREPTRQNSAQHSEGGDSDQLRSAIRRMSLYDDPWHTTKASPQAEELKEISDSPEVHPLQPTHSNPSNRNSTISQTGAMLPPPMALFDPDDSNRRFVGTPDYLAPETINGLGQDEMSDWWSIGCILFEFLFGYPPFHAETPDKVFDNILSRKIDWPIEDMGVSEEAKDLMSRLMCLDATERLGANKDDKFASGGEEIRNHPWFSDIDWASLNETEAQFIPQPENPENTEYFDSRGATAHDFATEFDDQNTSPAFTPGGSMEYPERPHDALTRARSNAQGMKRNLMPLHIPKHVREGRSRRMSEPAADDFGQFSFKNLPVLEKANKDVIQKLRAEAMQAQTRPPQQSHRSRQSISGSPPTLEGSPTLTMPTTKLPSNTRTSSPSQTLATSSPNRGSQPNSPLVQFSATGLHHERRKTSTGSSHASGTLQPGNLADAARPPIPLKQASSTTGAPFSKNAVSPVPSDVESPSIERGSPRTRSRTVGSREGGSEPFKAPAPHHQKHRSQVLDVSPSSSDNEMSRQKALLRVQRRRQSSRRMSQISGSDEGPAFRPLDVLVCEDHPVSKMVMEKLLGNLRCRTIFASNGAEAMQYAMSSVKFDMILMEVKLPQINGADVARMLRDTKNTNSQTPIVAVTGYLKELQALHHFEALVEKPASEVKLIEVLSKLCHWRPAPKGWTPPPLPVPQGSFPPSSLRNESLHSEESPTSTSATSGFTTARSNSYLGSGREGSVSSISAITEPDILSRHEDSGSQSSKLTNEPESRTMLKQPSDMPRGPTHALAALKPQDSAPPIIEQKEVRKQPSAELIEAKRRAMALEREQGGGDLGDDEDEELGRRPRSRSPRLRAPASKSKLSVEMLRTDSTQSVASVVRAGDVPLGLSSSPARDNDVERDVHASASTPPIKFPLRPGHESVDLSVDEAADRLAATTLHGDPVPTTSAAQQQSQSQDQNEGERSEKESVLFSISPPS